MDYTLDEKYGLIERTIKNSTSKNPIQIVKSVMKSEYINMHGPEHHFLDGAAFLIAYKNSGGNIDIDDAMNKLKQRSINMPGAMCGFWGVCGSVTSLGAALSIVHDTGPLSSDNHYKEHMEYTSRVINKMSKIGGPRCCKRNAYISISEAANFVKEYYSIEMELSDIQCDFSQMNKQCLKEKCPFNR